MDVSCLVGHRLFSAYVVSATKNVIWFDIMILQGKKTLPE